MSPFFQANGSLHPGQTTACHSITFFVGCFFDGGKTGIHQRVYHATQALSRFNATEASFRTGKTWPDKAFNLMQVFAHKIRIGNQCSSQCKIIGMVLFF